MSDLARALDIKPQSVKGALDKGQIPPAWFVAISEGFHVSLDYLVWGEGDMGRGPTDALRQRIAAELAQGGPVFYDPACGSGSLLLDRVLQAKAEEFGLALVKKVRARLNAGTGSLETDDDTIGLYAFRQDWLRSKGSPNSMVLMDVFGDSMSPEIEDGDTVLIDQGQTEVMAGRIFALGVDDEVLVKVLDKQPGKLVLRSLNPAYDPIIIDWTTEVRPVRIIGRIIWHCRED